ncbi:hypothetical protein M8U64_10705, partial [Enterobacter hormaechei]|nr:hypothetical protein [Enterobacter hormaechei]MDF3620671.1 hypothetical protein [Enterobacter hormaechei]
KSAQIREILISESAWEEMTCLFAPSLGELLPGINGEGAMDYWRIICTSSWVFIWLSPGVGGYYEDEMQ